MNANKLRCTLLMLMCGVLYLSSCITSNPFLNKKPPAEHKENLSPAITEQTFEEADINKDGKLDKAETSLANRIDESQDTSWPPHLTAFIAIIVSAVGATVVCMVISGFRGKPKGVGGTGNPGFGNFRDLTKETKEVRLVEEDFMGERSDFTADKRTEVSGLSG
jgi:hypothetical protein